MYLVYNSSGRSHATSLQLPVFPIFRNACSKHLRIKAGIVFLAQVLAL